MEIICKQNKRELNLSMAKRVIGVRVIEILLYSSGFVLGNYIKDSFP